MNNYGSLEQQTSRMLELANYGCVTESRKTSAPKVEYSKKAADGKTYGIVCEGTKFYIKVAPEKNSQVLAEDFGYIGGENNKSKNEYGSYAAASKNLELKLMQINESHKKTRVNVSSFKAETPADWQVNETVEMRNSINRMMQISRNVDAILTEDKNYFTTDHTLPEAPAKNPSEETRNEPFVDKTKAELDKDFKKEEKDPTNAGTPFENEVKPDMESDKKPAGNGEETYSEEPKYAPENSVADKKPEGGKVTRADESKKGRSVKLTESQVLAWQNVLNEGVDVSDVAGMDGDDDLDLDDDDLDFNPDFETEEEPEGVEGAEEDGEGEDADAQFNQEPTEDDIKNMGFDADAAWNEIEQDIENSRRRNDGEEVDDEEEGDNEDYLDFYSDGDEMNYDSRTDMSDYDENDEPLYENKLNTFGKHPSYQKEPMTTPANKEVAPNGAKDWNDKSAKGEQPYGNKIGSGAPFDKVVDVLTDAIMSRLGF